jgi:hypothetical protein
MLRGDLEEARAGQGRVRLLAGEPGIGKTRIAHELATYANQRGAQVLWGGCSEGAETPPLWPWVQIGRAYMAARAAVGCRWELGAGAAEMAQLLADVPPCWPDASLSPRLERDHRYFRFFDRFTTFLTNVSRAQPLVLFLEDLQWADIPSLLLLHFVTREVGKARLLVVGTYRDSEVHCRHPLTATLGELVREPTMQRLFLRRLTAEEVAHFIALMSGAFPSPAMHTAIYRQTAGNPFFLTEVVRLLVAAGQHKTIASARSVPALSLPQGIQAAIQRRLQRLSLRCRDVLTLASILGQAFHVAVLARLHGATSECVLELLEEAAESGIITAGTDGVGLYTFSHPLLRETLYAEVSPAQRERLHTQVGTVRERPVVAHPLQASVALRYTHNQPDDREHPTERPDRVLHTAWQLGMHGLVTKELPLQHRLPNAGGLFPLAEAGQGRGLSPVTATQVSSSSTRGKANQEDNLFRQEGDYWTLAYQGTTCRLKDAKGLHYIAALLRAPGKEFSAIDLVSTVSAGRGIDAAQEAVHDVLVRQPPDVGPHLDARAKAAYKRRLRELWDELADAQRLSDSIRATQARTEIDFLTHELTSALGIGGRNRTAGSIAERARSTVTKSIKATVQKICDAHPILGHHLATYIKTGTFCQYLPEPNQPPLWHL